MNTDIVVALIAAGAVLGGTMLGNFLLGRQKANDLRTNIEREVDIVRKLRPGSDEVVLLEKHISRNILELVTRDLQRGRSSGDLWLFLSIAATSMFLYAMGIWRESGIWEPIRPWVEVVYWGLWAVYALLMLRGVIYFLKLGKIGVKFGVLVARLGLGKVRLAWLKHRSKKLRREFEVRRAYAAYMKDWMEANKGEIVAATGQEWWDTMMAERASIDALGDEAEKRIEARDP